MPKALTPIKFDGTTFAAGEEVTGLSELQERALREAGALEPLEGEEDEVEEDDDQE